MFILPAIDLHNKNCVRLYQGDFNKSDKVADNPVDTAIEFQNNGATWIHVVDLDGAKNGSPQNDDVIENIIRETDINIEVGGGIRSLNTIDNYINIGAKRVILGSVAVDKPGFVEHAVKLFGKSIAVGIDARNGKVSTKGWLEDSNLDYLEFAKRMADIGVQYLIVTDISKDGTMNGPNDEMIREMIDKIDTNIIASGGIRNIDDIRKMRDYGAYGTICGKSIYSGSLDLDEAIINARNINKKLINRESAMEDELDRYFIKADLIPAVIQQYDTGKVLMLAYMNRKSLKLSLQTGYTWFYSRSRKKLWNKGETSGHIQKIISIISDCDDDTLLVNVDQTGNACHTGRYSCFYKVLKDEGATTNE
jgi:phosphoribosylformimino-5-aminoimidazole carboxamide ribotide isomerase